MRAMAQRDPLVEYQREGFQLFEAMNEAIKEESVGYLFNSEVQVPTVPESSTQPKSVDALLGGEGQERPQVTAKGLEDGSRQRRLHYSAPSEDGGVEERDEGGSARGQGSRSERRAAAKQAKKAKKGR